MANANLTCPEPISHSRWNLPSRTSRRSNSQRCGSRLMLATVLGSLGTGVDADLPLTLEEIISKKEEVTVELGFDYGNFYTSDFAREINQDALSLSFGMRYGLIPTTFNDNDSSFTSLQSRNRIIKSHNSRTFFIIFH